jgi:uncharacterized Zn finger protein
VREAASEKGRRYVAEARLTVLEVRRGLVRASCRGDGAFHQLGWTPERGWWCSCPALTDRCSHLAALRLVTVRENQR